MAPNFSPLSIGIMLLEVEAFDEWTHFPGPLVRSGLFSFWQLLSAAWPHDIMASHAGSPYETYDLAVGHRF